MYILDTNVFGDLRKGRKARPGLVALVAATDPARLHVSVITLGEIAFGAESAPDAGLRATVRRWLATQIELFADRILSVTVDTHQSYAALRAAAKRAGAVYGDNDLWIAAQAMEHAMTVVTRDKAFATMPGVRMLDPG